MRLIREIFIPKRFYAALSGIIILFITGFFLDPIYVIAKIALGLFALFYITDLVLLFYRDNGDLLLRREVPDRLSNGDENVVRIYIQNQKPFSVNISIYDEVPDQFQLRNFKIDLNLKAYEERKLSYSLTPKTRGEYVFGQTNIRYTTELGLAGRHSKKGDKTKIVPVYPSFLRMRKYELLAISNRLSEAGIKRVRRIGTHSEFDQIKDYVKGDNYRTINWRATAKLNKLMVNQYQEERSQNVYNVIDKGRLMQLPFDGMSLLDYAVNASLIMTNTAIQKHDKAGLITFNTKVDTFIKAERKNGTLTRIMENLYNLKTGFDESDYALLTTRVNHSISHRSLIILYTNFETLSSLQRQLKFFKSLGRNHVLLVVIFENREIEEMSHESAETLENIYVQTIAAKHVHDKKLTVRELMRNGIYAVLTRPQDLSANLINKYLELKDTGKF
ncbi:MAG TPA: DUF58 domain-containing protein [Bacteroidales bacterium]|nr:DUF58 domain-containing protein [Bacteroidales bacterium]